MRLEKKCLEFSSCSKKFTDEQVFNFTTDNFGFETFFDILMFLANHPELTMIGKWEFVGSEKTIGFKFGVVQIIPSEGLPWKKEEMEKAFEDDYPFLTVVPILTEEEAI